MLKSDPNGEWHHSIQLFKELSFFKFTLTDISRGNPAQWVGKHTYVQFIQNSLIYSK